MIPCLDLWPKDTARLTPPRAAQQPHSWHKSRLAEATEPCSARVLPFVLQIPLGEMMGGGKAPPPLLPGVACRQEGSYTLLFSCRGWDPSVGTMGHWEQRPRSLSQFSNEESPCPRAVRLSPNGDVVLF